MQKLKLKVIVMILVAGIMTQTGDTAVNSLSEVFLARARGVSELTFKFPQKTSYTLTPDFQNKVIKIVFPSTAVNPALEFAVFEDELIATVNFFTENDQDAVAEILLNDIKTSVYHSMSRDGMILTVNLRGREKLLAVKTDPSKQKAVEKRRAAERALKERLAKIQEESGREYYLEAMGDFQKNDFKEALAKLDTFLKRYPESVYREKAYFMQGETAYRLAKKRRARTPEAIEAYRLAIVKYPESQYIPRGRLRVADLLLEEDLDIEASATYDSIIANFPDSKFSRSALLGKANVFMKRKQFDSAFNELEKILLLYPEAKEARAARFKIAEAMYERQRYEMAMKIFEDSNKRWPAYLRSNAVSLDRFADTYYQMGRFDDALRLYTDMVNLFPISDEGRHAINRIADIYVKRGDEESALKLLGVQARTIPDDTNGVESRLRLAALGHAPKKLLDEKDTVIWKYPDYFEPIESYDDIVEKHPETKQARDAMFQKARLLNQNRQYVDSIVTLKTMMKQYPPTRFSEPALNLVQDNLFNLVRNYHRQEGYLTIMATYVQNFDPFFANIKNPEILMKVGEAYHEMGLYPRAVKKFERAAKLDKQLYLRERLVYDRGKSLAAQRKYDEAEETLLPFSDVMDNSVYAPDALHLLGDVFAAKGETDKTIKTYRRAIALDGNNKRVPRTAYNLGNLYKERGEYDESARHFALSIESYKPFARLTKNPDPFFVQESVFQLAEVYYEAGQYGKSINEARHAIETYPDHPQANWASYLISDSQVKISKDEMSVDSLKKLAEEQPGSIFGKVATASVQNTEWKKKFKDLFAN